MTPTPEQVAVVDAAKQTSDNLLVSALAGAAKTSTLELVAKALFSVPTLSVAFNKKIQVEMEKRLPGNVTSKTLNGLGHGVWAQAIGRKINLNADKIAELIKLEIEKLDHRSRGEVWDEFGDILRTINMARSNGYVPDQFPAQRLLASDEFYGALDEEPSPLLVDMVETVLDKSIKLAYSGEIDFADQLYMPTLFGGTWPRFPLIMVDEAQDLSPLNHKMLDHLVKSRLIAVGDPNQAIYGFRGAAAHSMSDLRERFKMRELPLSISFRCPRAVVELARVRAPNMQYPEWAKPGEVQHLDEWGPSTVPDGSAVLCRNNAPLFRAAFHFIRKGRGVKLVGTDIGPQLVRALKKLGDEGMSQIEVHSAINSWEAQKMKKSRSKQATKDRADCLRVFADNGQTLREAIIYAEQLFRANGPVQFMTGHKSKGLEFDNVFFLDEWLIGAFNPDDEQEHNLRYVIQTRAKERLVHVQTEGMVL